MSEIDTKTAKILLNGESVEVTVTTVRQLLESIGLDGRKVAVERNLEIVPKSAYDTTPILESDRIEVVHFVGGG
ncbi:sulfur carrier protein ThiS [Asticcacaulis tiandongensis]|uniref:sulfur carrier protein ThiS n=1 Tax=Asticcacaulis tiandongensis TaxID=2565365 RepID=UPI0011291A6C|nr:sulfur carrier protein ThiS [Asticcacaulis tiandongensis]